MYKSWFHWISGIHSGNYTHRIESQTVRNIQRVFTTSTGYVPILPFGQHFGLGKGRHDVEHIYRSPYEQVNAVEIAGGRMHSIDKMSCVLWTCLSIYDFEFVSIGLPANGLTEPQRMMEIIRPSTFRRLTKPARDIPNKFHEGMNEEDMFALCNLANKLPRDCNVITLQAPALPMSKPAGKSGKKRRISASASAPPKEVKQKGATIYTAEAVKALKKVNMHSPRVVLRYQPEIISFLGPNERIHLNDEFWNHYRRMQGLCIFVQEARKTKKEKKMVVALNIPSRKKMSTSDLNSDSSESQGSPAAKRVHGGKVIVPTPETSTPEGILDEEFKRTFSDDADAWDDMLEQVFYVFLNHALTMTH
jgi:hypothetical protein